MLSGPHSLCQCGEHIQCATAQHDSTRVAGRLILRVDSDHPTPYPLAKPPGSRYGFASTDFDDENPFLFLAPRIKPIPVFACRAVDPRVVIEH